MLQCSRILERLSTSTIDAGRRLLDPMYMSKKVHVFLIDQPTTPFPIGVGEGISVGTGSSLAHK